MVAADHGCMEQPIPDVIPNWIGGAEKTAADGRVLAKMNPASGEKLYAACRSGEGEVGEALSEARRSQPGWAEVPAVRRGEILLAVVDEMRMHREELAAVVALETGKSVQDALGETDGAISLGLFYASEGQRLYGRTTTSGVAGKKAMTVRMAAGVAGLIVAANTPIANVAWKVFPALVCGNTAVLKAAEDTPATAWYFGKLAHDSGLPPGVLNIVHGYGEETGAALVRSDELDVLSFTGSTAVGREISAVAARRLLKVSLELGGKNPLVVCDDADLDNAVRWSVLSAFSNAGQRCAAGSRIIVFESVFESFRKKLIAATGKLTLGSAATDDLGPVINLRQLDNMLAVVDRAVAGGARVLCGGKRDNGSTTAGGYYVEPTIIEGAGLDDEISVTELFGPITCLYRARNYQEALAMANHSPYGLTASIHTRNVSRALDFCHRVQTGVAVVNAGTYGSEPHMPFGGVKQSGNGWREPGTEALDIYTETKDIYFHITPVS